MINDPDPQCAQVVHAWVDPGLGLDPPAGALTSQVNDPDRPYRRLQTAIDALQWHLNNTYQGPPAQKTVGLVHAIPGLYGPHAGGSGDLLPIVMRDRVHVQGTSTRACVLRGVGIANTHVFWPSSPISGGFPTLREVLVTWQAAVPAAPLPSETTPPAWSDQPDTREFIDSWTFQGGEVQMYIGDVAAGNWEINARISNCVFDLRSGWKVTPSSPGTVTGPYFAIMLLSTFWESDSGLADPRGYFDRKAVIANNTFVFAEWARADANSPPSWIHDSRQEAVGIIDVVNPGCQTSGSMTIADAAQELRGVSNPLIVNNLFRTRPANPTAPTKPMAMVGIDARDTLASNGGPYRESNVFAADRVGCSTDLCVI
ncbi:MAG: hypothetical protein HZA52_03690 [Planctomycetes bacterium]|nr:hypothetical protein [Planctomycetota bacterium]